MTRHLADKRAPSDGGRTRAFLDIARKSGDGPHPAIKALMKRAQATGEARRMQEFLRIDRGREA